MTYYPDWESAAKASKQQKAISDPFPAILPGGRVLNVCIAKHVSHDPEYVYASCVGVRVKDMKCHARDCDRVRRWKPW